MEKYSLKATVSDDRSIVIGSLPFDPGDLVEISIRAYDKTKRHFSRYPLRGKPFQNGGPFESVAEDWDFWDALTSFREMMAENNIEFTVRDFDQLRDASFGREVGFTE